MTERIAEASEPEERKLRPLLLCDIIINYSRIWEKKYGKGAKHVVKQREDEAEKRRIREEKRRQREAAPKRPPWAAKRAFEPPKQTDSGYGGRSGRVDGQPLQNKPRREDKGLHPSWEAKKKMKEKQSAAIIPPAGKKIVF